MIFTAIYYLLLIIGIAAWARSLRAVPRQALVVGVVATTVTLGALPWHLFPTRGIATAVQVVVLLVAFLFGALRFTTGIRTYRQATAYMVLILALSAALALWTSFSHETDYGLEKSLLFLTRTAFPLLTLALLGPLRVADIRAVLVALVWGSTLMSLRLVAFVGTDVERAGFENLHAIGAGRIVGVGATILLVVLLHFPWHSLSRLIVLLALLGTSVVGMALTGSRGPLVAAVVSVILLSLIAAGRPTRWYGVIVRTILLGISLALLSLPFWLDGMGDLTPSVARLFDRFDTLGGNQSDLGRIDRYGAAIEAFQQSRGLGIGTGGFVHFYRGEGAMDGLRDYPHNVVLEAAAELGIVGLALVVGAMIVGLVGMIRLVRSGSNGQSLALSVLSLYGVVNAMFSYDLAGNSDTWLFLLLPLLAIRNASPRDQLSTGRTVFKARSANARPARK